MVRRPAGRQFIVTSKEKLGRLGEDLFVHLFGGTLSEDPYDQGKDLILNDRTIEIKTQNRHPTKDTLTIGSTQYLNNLLKCMVVDRLIFVEYDSTPDIRIWEVADRKSYVIYTIKSGLIMVGFPISKMNLLSTYTDAHLANQMRDLSSSSVFRKPDYL